MDAGRVGASFPQSNYTKSAISPCHKRLSAMKVPLTAPRQGMNAAMSVAPPVPAGFWYNVTSKIKEVRWVAFAG